MTAGASVQRRGACPGLSVPMPTGDGLLARLRPIGTIALDAFAELCAAARTHGNGIIEVTGRGSIQVRGLNPASAPRFAAAIAALGIGAEDGIAVLTNPLAGIEAEEILDITTLAADLRRTLAQASMAARLAPKISIVIDGGALDLDDLAADLRLRAEIIDRSVRLRVSVGGDRARAVELGAVAPAHGVDAAMRMLEVIARRGRDARARDILVSEGAAPFREALSSCSALGRVSTSYPRTETKEVDGRLKPGHDGGDTRRKAIGTHLLRDGSLACGIGLGFGHADAPSLQSLIEAAAAAGAAGVRAASPRVLMTIGLTGETIASFAAAAEQLGFIVRADDPRRYIIACAGAPVCTSAHIAARAIAPLVAKTAAPLIGRDFTIHISGCTKGCAHPAQAPLTVVGKAEGCALITNGSAGSRPDAVVPASELPEAIARAARRFVAQARHD